MLVASRLAGASNGGRPTEVTGSDNGGGSRQGGVARAGNGGRLEKVAGVGKGGIQDEVTGADNGDSSRSRELEGACNCVSGSIGRPGEVAEVNKDGKPAEVKKAIAG